MERLKEYIIEKLKSLHEEDVEGHVWYMHFLKLIEKYESKSV